MRAWFVLLAACSHTAASPPPAAPVAAAAPQSSTPPRPQPTQTLARVGVEHGSWTDVRIDGTDAAAQELCEKVVALEIARAQPVQLSALRSCATQALPRGVASPVQLVELEPVDVNDVMLGEMLTGKKPEHDLVGTGTLQRVFPLDTRQHCETLLAEMEGEDRRREAEIRRREARFYDEQIADMTRREAACGELATQRAECAKRAADDQPVCQVALDAQSRECERYKRQREILEARRARPPKPMAHPQRSCRVP